MVKVALTAIYCSFRLEMEFTNGGDKSSRGCEVDNGK